MSTFLYDIGLGKEWGVVDVIGLDSELLQLIPQPVGSLILLYPISKRQETGDGLQSVPGGVFYMKQSIGNACGTIALLNAVGNCLDQVSLTPGSPLANFYEKVKDMNPEERGKALETNTEISARHATSAQHGQTQAPDLNAETDFHFVPLIEKNGRLYELDGRKQGPIDCGPSSAATFLQDAAAHCMKIMSQCPDCLNFTIVALCKLSGPDA